MYSLLYSNLFPESNKVFELYVMKFRGNYTPIVLSVYLEKSNNKQHVSPSAIATEGESNK